MGIRNLRGLAGPQGCQAKIQTDDGEDVCHREENATVHRPDRKGYHAFVSPETPTMREKSDG